MSIKRRITFIAVGIAAVSLCAAGLVGGTALAGVVPVLFPNPQVVSSTPEGATAAAPATKWAHNSAGQSYGSMLNSTSPDNDPDLIQAVATNGKTGYVHKADLAAADGDPSQFKSPAEALAWQKAHSSANAYIPVYAVDGTTVIGQFLIEGTNG